MILDGFDRQEFLRSYWQRKPLLIKHTGKPFIDPIDADELAGLACEDFIESRIVSNSSDDTWHLKHGPFSAKSFQQLGDKNWTLLVQAVDQVDPDVALLKKHFDFLPGWRIDDVMVSFACAGGGVGPHFDQYDVFLIQGTGSRRWQIGERCNHLSMLRQGTELRLLEEFVATAEFVLEAGDILYLPPRFAHHGTSIGDSLCYSVGFRAPSFAELLQGYSDELSELLNDDQRFEDPLTDVNRESGAISAEAIETVFARIREFTDQKQHFVNFFGKLVTEPRYAEGPQDAADRESAVELQELVRKAPYLVVFTKNSGSRFAYFSDRDRLTLFVDGRQFRCQTEQLQLVQQLCNSAWPEPLELDGLLENPKDRELLISLVKQGSLLPEPASDE